MRDLSYYYGSMNYNEFFVPTPPHPATQDLLNGSQLSFMVGLMEEVYRAATCSEDHEEEIPEEQEGAGSQTWSNLVAFPGRDEKEDFDDVQPHLARLDHSSVLGGGGGEGGASFMGQPRCKACIVRASNSFTPPPSKGGRGAGLRGKGPDEVTSRKQELESYDLSALFLLKEKRKIEREQKKLREEGNKEGNSEEEEEGNEGNNEEEDGEEE